METGMLTSTVPDFMGVIDNWKTSRLVFNRTGTHQYCFHYGCTADFGLLTEIFIGV
jgi:hypothetical protein